jgi:hypothetical protein
MADPTTGSGMLDLRGETWWTKIHQDGRPFYESTGTKDEWRARKILHDRLTRQSRGRRYSRIFLA